MRGQSQKDAEFNEELEEVEKKYDDFELPESTYTFLLAEPIFSAPFAFGCVSYALVRSLSVSTILYIMTLSCLSNLTLRLLLHILSLVPFMPCSCIKE